MKVNSAAARWLERRAPNVFASVDCYAPLCPVIEKPLETEWGLRIVEIDGIDCSPFWKSPADEYACVNIEDFADADRVYDRFVVQLIEEPVYVTVDLVISNTLLEHVPNNRQAIPKIFGALRDSGETHYYVPSNWYPYSILLRLVGPETQRYLISKIRSETIDVLGYVVYFDECSPSGIRPRFTESGFDEIEVFRFYRLPDERIF